MYNGMHVELAILFSQLHAHAVNMTTNNVNTSRLQRFGHAFTSPTAFKQAIALSSSKSILINEDLAPSPPSRRTWTTWSFFAYWWSESWCVSTWAVGSSFIALGATLRDALLVVFFANVLSAFIIVANGRAASRYHIGYPVLARVSFGIYGQYFVVVLRSIFGIIWAAINMYFTGRFISICLRCIFSGWQSLRNPIPANQDITIQAFIGYIIAFFATLPFVFVHTSKIMHLFTVKSIIMPLAGLGIVIWATTSSPGADSGTFQEKAPPSVSVLAWGTIAQFDSVVGINSALLVTVPDLARYSKTPNAQVWGQLFALPIAQTICSAFGILATVSERTKKHDLTDSKSRPPSKIHMGQLTGIHMIFWKLYSTTPTLRAPGLAFSSRRRLSLLQL